MTRDDEHSRTLTNRVCAATTHILLERGLRKLRTAEIAELSGTTESTIFRHHRSLGHILDLTYSRCWALINHATSAAAFERPFTADPTQALLSDTAALWNMKSDHEFCEAATVAFLFLRRRSEMLDDDAGPCQEELRFQARIKGIVESIIAVKEDVVVADDHRAGLLTTLLMNYMATVWLTWFCMPTQSDDTTAIRHNLTPDEAQLGIIMLVDRVVDMEGIHAPASVDQQ